MPELEDILGISEATILKMADELGINWVTRKNNRGRPTRVISPEEADRLLTHSNFLATNVPDGFLALRGVSKALGLSEVAIKGIARRQGIAPTDYKDPKSGNIFGYFSPQQVALMMTDELVTTGPPPQGYKTTHDIARMIDDLPMGTARHKIEQISRNTGITPTRFKHPMGRVSNYFSPTQVADIIAQLQS